VTKKSIKQKTASAPGADPPIDRAIATELAECVLFAVKFLDVKSGAGMRFKPGADGKPSVIGRWQDTFFDALDKVGYEVDRDAYWKAKTAKRRRR
jgi:hypothetical protein